MNVDPINWDNSSIIDPILWDDSVTIDPMHGDNNNARDISVNIGKLLKPF